MSAAIRMAIGTMVERLIGRLNEVHPITQAEQRTEEGLNKLREERVIINGLLERIEGKNNEWDIYLRSLDETVREGENERYALFRRQERHFYEWVEEGREAINRVNIILANEDEESLAGSVKLMNVGFSEGQREEGEEIREEVRRGPSQRVGPANDNVSFPKAPWPYFEGDPLTWPGFWQQFSANAGDKNIPDVQKCSYLLLSLRGKAERAVKGYLATSENYQLIVNTLKRQFGDIKVIREALQNELLNLPMANESVVSLRTCFEEMERICRQLQNTGLQQGEDGEFMLMTVKNKFPRAVILEILKKEKESGKKWKMVEWRENLNEAITLREEAIRCTRTLSLNTNPFSQKRHEGTYKGNIGFRTNGFNKTGEVRRVFSVQERGRQEGSNKSGIIPKCFLCGKVHWAANCRQVTGREARLKIINEQGRCHKCLRKGHGKLQCSGKGCMICNQDHHKAICPRGLTPRTGANTMELGNRSHLRQTRSNAEPRNATTMAVTELQNFKRNEVLLMTTRVKIFAGLSSHRSVSAIVFFDCGSQSSFITDDLIKKLSPPRVGEGVLDLLSIRQKSPTRINSPKYFVKLELSNGKREGLIVNRIDHVTGNIKRVDMNSGEMVMLNEKPDILIGMAEFWKFFKGVSPITSKLFRVDTTTGPIVCGQLEKNLGDTPLEGFTASVREVNDEPEPKFWNLETIGVWDNPEEKDDEVAQKMFNDSVKRRKGRYVVSWPWRNPKEELPTNFALAYRRLVYLLGKMKITPNQLHSLDTLFKENLTEEIVEESEIKGHTEHFLPHHCVFTPGKKPRVVYDGSAKVRGGKCLNDMLFRGPIEMPQLPGLLIRSRIPRIALWGDIQRAFWTLELKEEDREYVKFLWVRDVTKPISQKNLLVLRFRRVPFGVISSPFLLGAAVRHHLKQEKSDLAKEIGKNLFVDNVFVGCKDEDEALEKYAQMKILFKKARMNLREFVSNSQSVNMKIPEEDRLEKEKPKVMGVKWDIKSDELLLEFPELEKSKITRRKVLKDLNSIFDPCGWAAPCLLPGKLFFQNLWDSERKWDDQLDETQCKEWKSITENWEASSFQFKRKVTLNEKANLQLHVFVDASKYAYATCVYLRSEGEEIKICLLYSRSRLKPKKLNVSIPRMELLGVLIGSRAIKFVEEELGMEIKEKFLWCDSKPVLSWVRSKEDQPRFVANRLAEIKLNTGLEFSYIPTEDNPADVASRGCTPEELKAHKLWWEGPRWMKKPREHWPKEVNFKVTPQPEEENIEEKLIGVVKNDSNPDEFIKFSKYKDWEKLVKLTARVMKISLKWLKKKNREAEGALKKVSDGEYITPGDYELAEKFVMRKGQSGWEEYVSKNSQIRWEKDKDGLIRLITRIVKSDTPKLLHSPIVFPKGSPILELLIQRAHIKAMHERVDATLNTFLGEFWAPGVRTIIKRVLKHCVICRKNHGPPYKLPEMPPHPEERMRRSKPFEFVALDYLGPSISKEKKKGGNTQKYWIVLITCLTTRGVYLEPVFDLTAESFLHVLRRFSSRRGKPKCIMSDNAQTFKLAAKAGGMYDAKNKPGKKDQKLDEYLTTGKIGWKFIPALSPWENGCAERLVKICKDAFKSALGRIILTPEELRTFTAEVESILNSRPITYVSTEPDGDRALRPIDFINPGAELGISFPERGDDEEDKEFKLGQISLEEKLRDRWKRTNKVLDIFWQRWNREYLVILRNRNQWTHKGPRSEEGGEPKVGEVVMVEDEVRPRNVWPMGRIVQLNGTPGSIRSVKIKMRSGRIVERPVNKLYPLEVNTKEAKEREEPSEPEENSGKIGEKRNETKQKGAPEELSERNQHPMTTRAKSRAGKNGLTYLINILVILYVTGSKFTTGREVKTGEKLQNCDDCKIKCEPSGIVMQTPDRMKKIEICCMGNCFTQPFTGKLKFQLPKEYLVVDHECEVIYWSKRRIKYKNKIFCPPVEECDMITLMSWDMILNPECWTKGTEIILGIIIFACLTLVTCIHTQMIWRWID